jgi:molecular chaperone DnaK
MSQEFSRNISLVLLRGGRITPSIVMFDGDQVTVGEQAQNALQYRPLDVVREVKRQMGNQAWHFMAPDGKTYGAEEISAFVLTRLKLDAEQKLGVPVKKAIVTVPAYFDDAKRRATQDAGEIAGLDVLRIINEPTAAALAYGIDGGNEGTVLVYDLGGGTFDVTVMRVAAGHLEVLFSGGDSRLGGMDWDNALMTFLDDMNVAQGGTTLLDDPSSLEALRMASRQAKHALSNRDSTAVYLPGGAASVSLRREQFEELTEGLVERTALKTEEVLEKAGCSWSQIDRLLLVGGATRMPMVIQRLEKISGKKPSHEVNPDEVVALGAAIQGALLDETKSGGVVTEGGLILTRVQVEDVTAHSLGVEAIGEHGMPYNAIVLPAGTKVPARGSELFQTMAPNQQVWESKVLQGEEQDLEWVTVIGTGTIRLTGRYPACAPMEVVLEYDANGVVHLFAIDRVSNLPIGELHIQRGANLDRADLEQKMRDAAQKRLN